MTANDRKSYLSYLNKLVDQYNNSYHHSSNKKPINPSLDGGGGGILPLPPPVGFPLIIKNSNRCNHGILQHLVTFHRYLRAKFDIPDSPQSPDIRKNSDMGISDFRLLVNHL